MSRVEIKSVTIFKSCDFVRIVVTLREEECGIDNKTEEEEGSRHGP
jgi:hypothetical protein